MQTYKNYANIKYDFEGKTYYKTIEYKSFRIFRNGYTRELKENEKVIVYFFNNPDVLEDPEVFEYIYLPCFLISIICFIISIIKRKEAKENKRMLNISIGIASIQIMLIMLSVVTGSIHVLNKIMY